MHEWSINGIFNIHGELLNFHNLYLAYLQISTVMLYITHYYDIKTRELSENHGWAKYLFMCLQ